jgi:hypothetical protein
MGKRDPIYLAVEIKKIEITDVTSNATDPGGFNNVEVIVMD